MTTDDAGYTIRVLDEWSRVPLIWHGFARHGGATPFQQPEFLAAWYGTLGARPGLTPVIVEATRSDGEPALLVPLCLRREQGLRVLSFPDDGVSDNNAPVVGPGAPATEVEWNMLWSAVRSALPPADLLRLEKMPMLLAGQINPVLWLGSSNPSQLNAHPLEIGDDYEAYSRSRTKKFRKEQERIWRVFNRHEGAQFDLVDDPSRRLGILHEMERLQSVRMAEIGASYLLDDTDYAALYRRLVSSVAASEVVLGALTAQGELVGALLGVTNGHSVTFVRLAHAGGEWSSASPGRLVIERTLMALHERGVRRFDFSVGDYSYKENFGVSTVPLADIVIAMSWRGIPASAASTLRAVLRQMPAVMAMRDRLRRKPDEPTVQSLARST
jgi:CelD/BcsL family acetyltransferase involved in cellulose biosynthesis